MGAHVFSLIGSDRASADARSLGKIRLAMMMLASAELAGCSVPAAPPPAAISQPQFSEFVRQSLYVPVRDGTKLAMNIYRPAVNGRAVETRLPVIFSFTPYRARY